LDSSKKFYKFDFSVNADRKYFLRSKNAFSVENSSADGIFILSTKFSKKLVLRQNRAVTEQNSDFFRKSANSLGIPQKPPKPAQTELTPPGANFVQGRGVWGITKE
jgi:hypothetical protein